MPYAARHSVLIADRHHRLAEGVRGLLETTFGPILIVADERSLVEGVERSRPDVVIADLGLACDGHLGWVRGLRQRWPEVKLILISVHDEDSVRRAVKEAGADAFVLKRALATDLLPAVERICAGQSENTSTRKP
jgi:DNA-binding NarL/FixJ family response regulator